MKKDRFYKSNGKWVPSGTTVLPRPYLAQWAANCAVDYVKTKLEGYDDYTELWELENIDQLIYLPARIAFLQESTEAAEYGTYIHTLCQHSLEHNIQIESPHEMTNKFMAGFWKWKEKYSVKVIAMEHEVLSEWYGGRLDLVCEIDTYWMTKAWCKNFGHTWYKGINKQRIIALVEFKTGKGSYYDTWKWQLAGYRQAYNENICDHYKVRCLGEPYSDNPCDRDCSASIQTHGVLKFNKDTMKVNYKDFNEYQATRTCCDKPRKHGKLQTEKYIRTYENDKDTFNACVKLWWITNQGINI